MGYEINENTIRKVFNNMGFKVNKIDFCMGKFYVIVSKNYSKNYNIEFDGNISLKAVIDDRMNIYLSREYYPEFYEVSNVIPHKRQYHINENGSLCYAPYQRPLREKWELKHFVNAVDALVADWFHMQYIGESQLKGLEHGERGIEEYIQMISTN